MRAVQSNMNNWTLFRHCVSNKIAKGPIITQCCFGFCFMISQEWSRALGSLRRAISPTSFCFCFFPRSTAFFALTQLPRAWNRLGLPPPPSLRKLKTVKIFWMSMVENLAIHLSSSQISFDQRSDPVLLNNGNVGSEDEINGKENMKYFILSWLTWNGMTGCYAFDQKPVLLQHSFLLRQPILQCLLITVILN